MVRISQETDGKYAEIRLSQFGNRPEVQIAYTATLAKAIQ